MGKISWKEGSWIKRECLVLEEKQYILHCVPNWNFDIVCHCGWLVLLLLLIFFVYIHKNAGLYLKSSQILYINIKLYVLINCLYVQVHIEYLWLSQLILLPSFFYCRICIFLRQVPSLLLLLWLINVMYEHHLV